MTFAGNPFVKVKLRHLPGTSLKAITASYALFFVDDHRAMGQLFDGRYWTDTDACRFIAMLAGPVQIGMLCTVFGVVTQIDNHPVLRRKMRLAVGNQLIALHSQVVPALTGRHTTLAANTSERIHQFTVYLCLGGGNSGGTQRYSYRYTG